MSCRLPVGELTYCPETSSPCHSRQETHTYHKSSLLWSEVCPHSSESLRRKDYLTLLGPLIWPIALAASFLGANMVSTVTSNFIWTPNNCLCTPNNCYFLIQFGFDGADGVYLTEVDRVLRPGGYWILSGPPIRWQKYWKGWERTKEDLNAEQTSIEDVAKSLCWKKLAEKDDIAIWQKPTNHLTCQNNRKLGKSRNFCPANDPDKAWFVL